ncbi:fimbria/pilus outer membrane usher protein [Pararhizobium sp. LjRoot235]|uniref:fimbria/pilus outer membrane usher protein n=1 Tax=Pararhizobium sp. LjRoot235 TaxID=3342291 RepID=UPI003ECC2BBA
MQLEVFLRGQPTGLIGAFREEDRSRLSATRRELEELGVKVPPNYKSGDPVFLSDLTGLRYQFDEPAQTIDIDLPESMRLPKTYHAQPVRDRIAVSPPGVGALINYDLYGSSGGKSVSNWNFQGLSAALDARLFSAFGIASQTAVVTSDTFTTSGDKVLRLDSRWSYSDPERQLTYTAGDTISSSMAWTRPVRFGGFQVQRNFALRPDLIALPLASVSGSAAVPSTVDVYINGVKNVSQEVASGPFSITDLPVASGQGDARVVVRDATGRETETTQPFFVSGNLLRKGFLDFSAEVGFPRLYYGALSNEYSGELAGSASLSYGLTDRFTLQAHAEGTPKLANGGLGAVFNLADRALVSGAGAVSYYEDGYGGLAFGSIETKVGDISISASAMRTFGKYEDVASVTAQSALLSSSTNSLGYLRTNTRPSRALDRVSAGMPLSFAEGSLNFSYIRNVSADGDSDHILSVGYSRQILGNAALFVNFWTDIGDNKNSGIMAGVSVPIGGGVSSSLDGGRDENGAYMTTEVVKPVGQEPGSLGWRLRGTEGAEKHRSTSLGYRTNHGQVDVAAEEYDGDYYARGELQGSLVAAGGDVFLANRIDDAFAVVDAGAADVPVLYENKPVATTGSSGKALVTRLRSYEHNKIAIDPAKLPINATIGKTEETVVPADRSGVIVDFGVDTKPQSAIVLLNAPTGEPLRAGLTGQTGAGQTFVVGYDGRAFITKLQAKNELTVELAEGVCHAVFSYAPKGDQQVSIGPVICE